MDRPKLCLRCGKEIPRRRGRPSAYCSAECRMPQPEERRGVGQPCQWCGTVIPKRGRPRGRPLKYCSVRCSTLASTRSQVRRRREQRAAARLPLPEKTCEGCGRRFTPRSYRRPDQQKCRKDCGRPPWRYPPRNCQHCGIEFRPKLKSTRYCSRQCADASRASKYGQSAVCSICHSAFKPVGASWHPRKYCSRRCASIAMGIALRGKPVPWLRGHGRPALTQEQREERRRQSNAKSRAEHKAKYQTDAMYREEDKRKFRNYYAKNRDRVIAKSTRWKVRNAERYAAYMYQWQRNRDPNRPRRIFAWQHRVAGFPCLECGTPVPDGRLVYCSDECVRRDRTGSPDRVRFARLLPIVTQNPEQVSEVIDLAHAWRALRFARRSVNRVIQTKASRKERDDDENNSRGGDHHSRQRIAEA